MDRLMDPFTLEGKPRLILSPTIDQEVSGKGAVSPRTDWHTVEGVFYLHHGKEEYLMYSGNSFEREDYFIGYARPDRESCLRDESWRKYPGEKIYAPFCRKTDLVEGTGHNSVTKAPNLVDDWCVYHARLTDSESRGGEHRLLFTDRILWDRQEMWLAGPTLEDRDAPAGPGFSDFFENDLGGWESVSGRWKIENRRAVQEDASEPARLRWKKSCRNFVMEAWVRTELQPHGSLLGVGLHGNGESLEFLLHEGLRQAEIFRWKNGIRLQERAIPLEQGYAPFAWHCIRLQERAIPLEQGYAPFAWHCIRLEKCGKQVRFFLDGFELAEVPCSQEEVAPELYTQLCRGEFAAFALTSCMKAEGERLSDILVCETDSGIFEGSSHGITYFTPEHGEGSLTLPFLPAGDYEVSMDLYPEGRLENSLWQLELSESTAVGIRLERGRFLTDDGELPASPLNGHTIHVRVQKGKAAVLLDRHCVYCGPSRGASRFSLKVNDCVRITGLEAVERSRVIPQ